MYKEVWLEESNAAGISFLSKRRVRSRKRKTIEFNLEVFLDKAVTAVMYIWAVVLSIATAAVLIDIWR